MNPLEERLAGCLLGCAVGDALGLPYEGLRPRRLERWIRLPLGHRFIFGRGMVSDDTDHTVFVAQSLGRHPDDPKAFASSLAWKLRFWLLCLPAGIGLATLRSIVRLWAGFSPTRSGVFSAGNGAAMRSAVIGAYHSTDQHLRRRFVSASTRITHSDPKADFGALAIAEIASFEARNETSIRPSLDELRELLESVSEEGHWREIVDLTIGACSSGSIKDALPESAGRTGVTGYVYHTVPAAVAGWFIHYGDVRKTIESVVRLGGDTDSVAAIAGALAGIGSGSAGLPTDWVLGIADRPHGPAYLRRLSASLASGTDRMGFSLWLFPRGLVFTSLVLLHGFRRLLPPY